jgi:hypothetical protein
VTKIVWDIRREGRVWRGGELAARLVCRPEKFEVLDGALLWSEAERLCMLGLVLEPVGLDKAVRLGDPEVWKAAVADRPWLRCGPDPPRHEARSG